MVHLLLEDVTLVRRQQIAVDIGFRGGVTRSAPQSRKTKPAVIAEIDRLLNTNTESEIAAILNEISGQAFRISPCPVGNDSTSKPSDGASPSIASVWLS